MIEALHSVSLCLVLLQLKNVDFEGLFGNIGAVIGLSQRLLETLQDTDSIGEKPPLPYSPSLPPPLLSFSKDAKVEERANQPSTCLPACLPAGCTLHFTLSSPVNILVSYSHVMDSKTFTMTAKHIRLTLWGFGGFLKFRNPNEFHRLSSLLLCGSEMILLKSGSEQKPIRWNNIN